MWLVNPKAKRVVAHTADKAARIYTVDDTLDGGDVLPGFQVPLAELFG